jgi:hypothetical protein
VETETIEGTDTATATAIADDLDPPMTAETDERAT